MILEILNSQKKHKTRHIRKIIRKAIEDTIKNCCIFNYLKDKKITPVFSVTLTDNRHIKELNSEYRGIDKVTDVLSFPGIESNGRIIKEISNSDIFYDNKMKMRVNLGDIIISLEKAYDQSKEYEHSFDREIYFLTMHSVLHLLGYNHSSSGDEKIMFSKQKKIINNTAFIQER